MKTLYGLKQAWYSHIDAYVLKKDIYKHTLSVKSGDKKMVCLYVDDLIYTGNYYVMFGNFKQSMMIEFDIFDLGMTHYFLDI